MSALSDSALQAKLAEIWLQHTYPGEVITALGDAWIICECGRRVDVPVRNLTVSGVDVRATFSRHVAVALATVATEHAERVAGEARANAWDAVHTEFCPMVVGFTGCQGHTNPHRQPAGS